MKYCILIIDGAAGLPLPGYGGQTSLELANTPYLDEMVREGMLGLVQTVPSGMEPSSAGTCMSVLGYDPEVYYRGRAGIEARSLNIPVGEREVVFRCNLVATLFSTNINGIINYRRYIYHSASFCQVRTDGGEGRVS